jgi:hypothetical protein
MPGAVVCSRSRKVSKSLDVGNARTGNSDGVAVGGIVLARANVGLRSS